MKVVIAPDSFKGCLSAEAVAAALARGVRAARPDAVIDVCPMADGGEGTVRAMVAAAGGELRTVRVSGPLGEPVRAEYGLLPGDPSRAVIEMAAASGLTLVPEEQRDPLATSTYGTGELLLAALDAGAREILLGIGGSATVDGGAGCAQALGAVFTGPDGEHLDPAPGGGDLLSIRGLDLAGLDRRLGVTRIRVACDVTNPLLGQWGAAEVYGPQKGATPEAVLALTKGLTHWAGLLLSKTGHRVADLPGAGAAGGLGAGLVALIGATLESGFDLVAEAVGLADRLGGADLCLTGEGRLDAPSAAGKTSAGVARIARSAGVPVVCIPGQAGDDAPRHLFDGVSPLVRAGTTPEESLDETAALLARRAEEAVLSLP